MADVLLQVQQLRPDIIVLHEKLALDHDPTVIAQIRRISPRTSIVLLAGNREALPPELILLADAVVEDGPGLTELGVALAGPPRAKDATTDVEATGVQAPAVASPARLGSRWADRLQGLAVASIIALAFVIARDMTTPSLVPTVVGRAHMVRAWDSLDKLESALPTATTEQIVEIASVLIDERAAAEAGGINLTSFDQELRELLVSNWPELPLETQTLLVALFQGLIDDSDVPPLPSPSPEPTPPPAETTTPPPAETTTPPPAETTTPPPAETTTPPPAETTTPPPAETTTPPPAETTTPPPAETTTPPPAETTTPPPTKTQSGSLVLIPFAFTLMLAISGWARRRSHRSADGPD
jgi:hypothetical protein